MNGQIEKGAILHCSWGYEQTNADFYEVQNDAAAGQFVKLLKLNKTTKVDGALAMTGSAMPVLGVHAGGPVLKRKLNASGFVKINDYQYAHLWNGKPASTSWYA